MLSVKRLTHYRFRQIDFVTPPSRSNRHPILWRFEDLARPLLSALTRYSRPRMLTFFATTTFRLFVSSFPSSLCRRNQSKSHHFLPSSLARFPPPSTIPFGLTLPFLSISTCTSSIVCGTTWICSMAVRNEDDGSKSTGNETQIEPSSSTSVIPSSSFVCKTWRLMKRLG